MRLASLQKTMHLLYTRNRFFRQTERRRSYTHSIEPKKTRVIEILKQNHLEYEVVSKRNQSTYAMHARAKHGMRAGFGEARVVSDCIGPVSFVYHIYVRGKDLARARNLAGI